MVDFPAMFDRRWSARSWDGHFTTSKRISEDKNLSICTNLKRESGWWWLNPLEKWWNSSMGFGWHPIYYMENKSHVWNHQPGIVWIVPPCRTIPVIERNAGYRHPRLKRNRYTTRTDSAKKPSWTKLKQNVPCVSIPIVVVACYSHIRLETQKPQQLSLFLLKNSSPKFCNQFLKPTVSAVQCSSLDQSTLLDERAFLTLPNTVTLSK